MHIQTATTDSFSRVSPFGRIDAATCPELRDAVNGLMDGGATRIVLDLQETVYISSAGLRVILNAAKRLYGTGQIVISNVAPEVRRILEVAGIPDVIDVYPDTNSAGAAFERG